LEEEGFTCSRTEPCLFFKRDDTGLVYILIHGDDTFIFTDKEEKLSEFVAVMNRRMPMTLDEKGDSFLGIKIEQHHDGSIELSQPKLLSKILKVVFGMVCAQKYYSKQIYPNLSTYLKY
jgi:hypothetical protein